MSEQPPLVEVEAVHRYYDDGLVKALNGIDLTLEAGRVYALMGPSGCGKSTLLNLIGGIDLPDRGLVRFRGRPLRDYRSASQLRREQIGFVFQAHHLLPLLSLQENVELPLLARRDIAAEQREQRARELLELLGLRQRMHLPAARVSGGERQRAAIARALVNRPRLLLADEPTGSVDSATTAFILEMLVSDTRAGGGTLLLATHDSEVAAYADRRIEMRDGRLSASSQNLNSQSMGF